MGCGIFPSLAEAPALATGPAWKQEQRKCLVRGGRRGRANATAKGCALGGCGFGPGPAVGELILQGSQKAAALWGDRGCRPGRAGGSRQQAARARCLQETEATPAASSLGSESQAGFTFG